MDLLAKYAELQIQRVALEQLIETVEAEIAAKVEKHGPMSGYGFKAHVKPGRRVIDHQAAALEAGATKEIIEAHTKTPQPRTSWAKVTAELGVPKTLLEKHATYDEPKVAIDILK